MTDLPPLPPNLRALIADERDAPGPDDGARARVRGRIAVSLGLAVIAETSAEAATTSAEAATTSATTAATGTAAVTGITGKLIAIAIAVGIGGGGSALLLRDGAPATSATLPERASAEPAEPAESAEPAEPAEPAPGPSGPPVELPPVVEPAPVSMTPQPARAVPRRSPRVAPASAVNAGAQRTPPQPAAQPAPAPQPALDASQRALLAQVLAASSRGDLATALSLLEHDQRVHGDGALSEEREAIRVDVLLRLWRYDEARARATDFMKRYPTSILRSRVERALVQRQ
jgi:hypothetical protein